MTTPAIAPPAATNLVLVRHAVTAQTGPLLSGRTPGIDLSEEGEKQASELGARMAALPIRTIYASPIERTTQTARAIAAHHAVEVRSLDGVLEADYGEWTGQKIADLAKTDLWKVVQRSPSRAVFPGGEAMAAMQTRMVVVLERWWPTIPVNSWWWSRTPIRSRPPSPTRSAPTSTCSSASSCRRAPSA